jgi:hypothetical protein
MSSAIGIKQCYLFIFVSCCICQIAFYFGENGSCDKYLKYSFDFINLFVMQLVMYDDGILLNGKC